MQNQIENTYQTKNVVPNVSKPIIVNNDNKNNQVDSNDDFDYYEQENITMHPYQYENNNNNNNNYYYEQHQQQQQEPAKYWNHSSSLADYNNPEVHLQNTITFRNEPGSNIFIPNNHN
jgi:hypothetical protein